MNEPLSDHLKIEGARKNIFMRRIHGPCKLLSVLMLDNSYWFPRPHCPRLFLAPMEGLNDQPWRRAYSRSIAGFDEACSEFIRMPMTGHAKSLAKAYDPSDTLPMPMAAQIMGECPKACSEISYEIEQRGAWRIDLNCGCPSNTVVGKGAGSSLLKTPPRIYEIVREMKRICSIPITVKIRAGYTDDSLFHDVLQAIETAGASFITLHPRTREQGYSGKARWELIAKAKELCSLPIIASGDVTCVEHAKQLYEMTHCDGIMIGRGSFIDPWIFWKIRAHFAQEDYVKSDEEESVQLEDLLRNFLQNIAEMSPRGKLGRLKQILRFLQQRNELLKVYLKPLLIDDNTPEFLLTKLMEIWREYAKSSPSTSGPST